MLKARNIFISLITTNDLEDVYRILLQPQNMGKIYLSMCAVNSDNIGEVLTDTGKNTSVYVFGVYSNISGALVGFSVLNNVDHLKRSGKIQAVVIDEDFHSHGYGAISSALVTEFGFKHLGLHRLYATTWGENERIEKIYRFGGWRLEGTEKEEAFINGRWVDRHLWAVLSHEISWENVNRIIRR